jgi:hypothetical protein
MTSPFGADGKDIAYLASALAWLEGWLVEQRGAPQDALEIYAGGVRSGGGHSSVCDARLRLAHG